MTDLPPYSFGRAVCRKCEANDASTEYQVAATCLVWRSGTGMALDESTPGNLAPDAMLRRCRQCGWAWLEACADTPDVAHSASWPHVDRADWVLRLWRDWPQYRRDTVRNLSHHLADAIEALDPANLCAYCATIRTADDACTDTRPVDPLAGA